MSTSGRAKVDQRPGINLINLPIPTELTTANCVCAVKLTLSGPDKSGWQHGRVRGAVTLAGVRARRQVLLLNVPQTQRGPGHQGSKVDTHLSFKQRGTLYFQLTTN